MQQQQRADEGQAARRRQEHKRTDALRHTGMYDKEDDDDDDNDLSELASPMLLPPSRVDFMTR
jgi:hypothetical protein